MNVTQLIDKNDGKWMANYNIRQIKLNSILLNNLWMGDEKELIDIIISWVFEKNERIIKQMYSKSVFN